MAKHKVTILFSPFGGLAHCVAHLAKPLSRLCQLQFVTYRKWYPTGEMIKSLTDFLLKKTIKRAYFIIEHDSPDSLNRREIVLSILENICSVSLERKK